MFCCSSHACGKRASPALRVTSLILSAYFPTPTHKHTHNHTHTTTHTCFASHVADFVGILPRLIHAVVRNARLRERERQTERERERERKRERESERESYVVTAANIQCTEYLQAYLVFGASVHEKCVPRMHMCIYLSCGARQRTKIGNSCCILHQFAFVCVRLCNLVRAEIGMHVLEI